MSKINAVKKQAIAITIHAGHKIGGFRRIEAGYHIAKCSECGRHVSIDMPGMNAGLAVVTGAAINEECN